MKKLALIVLGLFALVSSVAAQAQPERRLIEVSGSAERLVTPNEFTFRITLAERMENRQKLTIEQQEMSLRNELTSLGVDVAKDLSIYDIASSYFRQKKIKDVLGAKDYRLKIRDLNQIARLQDIADRLNVSRLDLVNSDHSDITRLRRETKIDAVKAAKEKAIYLLGAVGETIGKTVLVQEGDEETPRYGSNGNLSNSITVNITSTDRQAAAGSGLSFSQIRLRYVIVAKFEIE